MLIFRMLLSGCIGFKQFGKIRMGLKELHRALLQIGAFPVVLSAEVSHTPKTTLELQKILQNGV